MLHLAIHVDKHLFRPWLVSFKIVNVLLILSVNQIMIVNHVWIIVRHVPIHLLVIPVYKYLYNKIKEYFPFVLVQQGHFPKLIMTVLTVFKIVKLVLMVYPATLANHRPPRQWHEFYQIVTARLIILVNPILIVCLFVYLSVKPVLIWFLATLVKKLFINKTQELLLFVLAPQDLTQLQTMTVQIVSQIVKLVQMQHPVILANQRPPRQWHEFYQIVNARLII
jgi:hypothetical protein